jgi:hypothetical protein
MIRHMIAFCFSAGLLLAQSNVASVTGIVSDTTEAAVANAEITIRNLSTGILFRTATNEQGVYVAPSLLPGGYSLEVQAPGFKRYQIPSFNLDAAQRLRLDVRLEVGDVQQVVDVQASVTPLMQESSEVSKTITAKDIQSIPLNGRIAYSLLALTPGVVARGDDPSNLAYDSQLSVNGSRRGSNAYVIDGASTTHIGGIGERVGSIESIQEFKVLASTYSAEYGRRRHHVSGEVRHSRVSRRALRVSPQQRALRQRLGQQRPRNAAGYAHSQ